MKSKTKLFVVSIFISGALLASCAAAEPIEYVIEPGSMSADEAQSNPDILEQPADDYKGITYTTLGSDSLTLSQRSDRLIIKNAEIKLLVENTDTTVDRTTQIVADVGGYIISSRVWYQDWGDDQFKFSTITIGVPSSQFERTLRRLRDTAIRVLDENATGEDVTDEYVDLESRLENLIATRDRIRGFLDQAQTVEEALDVNEELSKVEGQIEEIQGRINYLSDRAAFSTITITIEPELKELPTPTPRPTSTPTPWNPGETFGEAKDALTNTYKGLIDFAIWIFVVLIPVIAPFVFIGWLIWRFTVRKDQKKDSKKTKKS